VSDNADDLHRRLGNRQIQLLAIGGSIGKSFVPSCLACDRRREGGMRVASIMRSPLYHSSMVLLQRPTHAEGMILRLGDSSIQ
jgi:NAD-dependent SIR2 family protein deacetylase